MAAGMRVVRKQVPIAIVLVIFSLILITSPSAGLSTGEDAPPLPTPAATPSFSPGIVEDGKPVVYFFFNRNCASCLDTLPFIEEFGRIHPEIEIHYIDIRESEENLVLFDSFKASYGAGHIPVPAVFTGTVALSGEEEIRKNLSDAVNGTLPQPVPTPSPEEGGSSGQTLTIPLVIASALADGINPCAFAVLIILILSLINLESRRKMLAVGLTFIFAVFCFYFLSGLGLFAVIQSAGISRLISVVAAAIAIAAGVISILSVVGGGKGPALLSIPDRGKGIIEPYLKRASVPAAFILGILVGMFELPCTGGIYLAILSLLSTRMSLAAGIPYLLLYNLFFIVPLLVILGIFLVGIPVERLEQWQAGSRRTVRVIMGLVMIALGLILLVEVL